MLGNGRVGIDYYKEKKVGVMQRNNLDYQLMIMAACRYCLGRQSYIVGAALSWLRRELPNMGRNTVRVIVRDIVEALQDDRAGSPTIDAPGWKQLAEEFWLTMPLEDRAWVMADVQHRRKPWPLATTAKPETDGDSHE